MKRVELLEKLRKEKITLGMFVAGDVYILEGQAVRKTTTYIDLRYKYISTFSSWYVNESVDIKKLKNFVLENDRFIYDDESHILYYKTTLYITKENISDIHTMLNNFYTDWEHNAHDAEDIITDNDYMFVDDDYEDFSCIVDAEY